MKMNDSSETERIQIITEGLKNNEHKMVVKDRECTVILTDRQGKYM